MTLSTFGWWIVKRVDPSDIVVGGTYMYPYYINSKTIPFRPCRVVCDHGHDERRYVIEWLLTGEEGVAFKNSDRWRKMPEKWAKNEIDKKWQEIQSLKQEIRQLERLDNEQDFRYG